jgi:acetamidase/formamidase
VPPEPERGAPARATGRAAPTGAPADAGDAAPTGATGDERVAEPALVVEDYVWVLDPDEPMLGPVASGSTVRFRAPPGCWGSMLTPDHASGHEVTRPLRIAGARPGDAVVLRIESIRVLSAATVSGTHAIDPEHHAGDPGVAARCPGCGLVNPATALSRDDPPEVTCRRCGSPVRPYRFAQGYTMAFDDARRVGVTVRGASVARIRRDAQAQLALPAASRQYAVTRFAMDSPWCVCAPVEPMIGNLGTLPPLRVPSSRNAGDLAGRLAGLTGPHRLDPADIGRLTDGHMDINEVRAGAVVVAPVRVDGAGVYVGDVHAMQGDGELADHTTDVAAEVTLQIEVIEDLRLPGPIVLARPEDLPRVLRPLTPAQRAAVARLENDPDRTLHGVRGRPEAQHGSGRSASSGSSGRRHRPTVLRTPSVCGVRRTRVIYPFRTGAMDTTMQPTQRRLGRGTEADT